ncbi:MAG: malate dehydrogenase [Spirochaetales bacterium]|nr:malate dehydrogenase [Spirochaetales bacterium]
MSNPNLDYHAIPVPGKLSIEATKPCNTQAELSMAYSPGVADPCLEIHAKPENVYDYTAKGNLVAVVSDGTAVLGLGDIGPHAGLPVMEGKSVLFKRFAGIDAIGICLSHVRGKDGRTDPARVIETVERLEPAFGGINLEDIGAPACFEIEEELKKRMPIPVFHDDQHGTAIICTAGILNSLKILGKDVSSVRMVINGAGAAGISCAEMCVRAGIRRENILMCDSKGVIHRGRAEGLSAQKAAFAAETSARTLADALSGADVFLGLSVANCVTREMVASMAKDPVIFAMANPVPEIAPAEAVAAGAAVVGTGRSDFHNQVNNVLGFPGIFRGALDSRASSINEEMKMAAALALADLASREIPAQIKDYLSTAYPKDADNGMFDGACPLSREYVIPKPFDPRVVPHVARAVAEAAVRTGVARAVIDDFNAYEKQVAARIAAGRQ